MAKNKKNSPGYDPKWAKAKNDCRLNMVDIQMAKELGMSPKSLLKNIPGPNQHWKAPVKEWIRDLHEKRFGAEKHAAQSKPSSPPSAKPPPARDTEDDDLDNIPF